MAAFAAAAFLDSEGINTHFSESSYTRDPELPKLLKDLGIRHLRDGIELGRESYVEELNAVSRATGAGFDLITDGGANAFGHNAQTSGDIAAFVGRIANVDAIEAPNEYDTRCCNWKPALLGYLPALRAAKTGRTIIGPALTSSYAYDIVGDVSNFVDASNMHDYFAGFPPETPGWGGSVAACGTSHRDVCGRYASLQYAVRLANVAGPALPVYSTETGYGTGRGRNEVDEIAQGKYVPRLLLNQFRHGIVRTYLYQLCDFHGGSPGYQHFGLLAASPDYRTHTEKPAFKELSSINALLADPGPAFEPAPLSATLTGASDRVESVVLEKRDGTYWIALWCGDSSFDVDAKPPVDTAVAPANVSLELDGPPAAATAYRFDDAGAPSSETYPASRSFSLSVTDSVTLLKIDRRG